MDKDRQQIIADGRLRHAQLKMLEMLKFVARVCDKYQLEYWLEGGTLLGAVRHQGFIPWDDDLDISMPRDSYNQFLIYAARELPDSMWLQTAKTDPGYYNVSVPLKIRDRNSYYLAQRERGDEPYHLGIYIDIFVYDKKPEKILQHKLYNLIGKKLNRLLHHKYAAAYLQKGSHKAVYAFCGRFIPKAWLEGAMSVLINNANKMASPYLGYGYDSINCTYFRREVYYPLQKVSFEDGEFYIPNQPEIILRHQYGEYSILPPEERRVLKHCRELVVELEGAEL